MTELIQKVKKGRNVYAVEMYPTWFGYVVRIKAKNGYHYLVKRYNGDYSFCEDFVYAKGYSWKTAKAIVKDLIERIKEL